LVSARGLAVLEAREVLRPVTLEPGHGSVPVGTDRPADAIDHVVVAHRPE
jgi:hypothetical protein